MTYFNTTNQTNPRLQELRDRTRTQNQAVLYLYKDALINGMTKMSASEVYRLYISTFKNVPLTSIRRAITTLKNNGELKLTTSRTMGLYGEKEYQYQLKSLQLEII
ncbi:MAG: hypothetical protein O2887_10445 [Bacteroidetes bacterium]|nr:hypothetical protein [Bacteroidota bacterium]